MKSPFFATSFIVCLTVTDRDEKILLRPEVGWMDIKLKVTRTKISDVTFCTPSFKELLNYLVEWSRVCKILI